MLNLNSEQKARPARVRCFVEEVIAPRSAEIDRKQEFPMEFRCHVC
jgi:alkylation response protein AidB-like acyl-CoA dehydrogenase